MTDDRDYVDIEQDAVMRGAQQLEETIDQAQQFAKQRDERVVDMSGFSGPPGQPIGFPEDRDPRGGLVGAYRLSRNFNEDAPPLVDMKDTIAGVELDVALGFPCRSIMVDNYTSQWAYIGRRYIAPYQLTTTIWMPVATQRGRVVWEAPPGIVQPALVLPNAKLFVTWCERDVKDGGGSSGRDAVTAEGAAGAAVSTTIIRDAITPSTQASVQSDGTDGQAPSNGLTTVSRTYGWDATVPGWSRIRALNFGLKSVIGDQGINSTARVLSAPGFQDGNSNSADALHVASLIYLSNGVTLDRQTCNFSKTAIALAANNTFTTADIININARFIDVITNVTVLSGTLQVTINAKDPTSGQYYPLLVGAAISGVGLSVLRVGPGLSPAAGSVANFSVPRTLQIVCTSTISATYSVGINSGV